MRPRAERRQNEPVRAETVIATHGNTDFDAFAAMLAARHLYPGAIVAVGPLNRNVRDFYRLHAEELSRFNRLAVGRELRMIELKKEINELCGQQGLPARYPLEFERDTGEAHGQESPRQPPPDAGD